VTLPGREVARIRVVSNFGESETNEGSVVALLSGSLQGLRPDELVVVTGEAQ
jgi:hypothetical protein